MGSVIFAATPVGFSARESLLELLAVDGAGDSLPATLRSGVEAAEGSALIPKTRNVQERQYLRNRYVRRIFDFNMNELIKI